MYVGVHCTNLSWIWIRIRNEWSDTDQQPLQSICSKKCYYKNTNISSELVYLKPIWCMYYVRHCCQMAEFPAKKLKTGRKKKFMAGESW